MADSWWESRTRPSLDSVSVTSMNLFQDTTESTTTTTTSGGGRGGGVLGNNPNLHMMELGLSSQPIISQSLDWNQALYPGDQRNDHHQSGYPTLIQEDHSLSSNTSNFQDSQWKSSKIHSDSPSEFKQINVRGVRLEEPMNYNDENGLNPSFQTMDNSYGSNSTILQSLFGSDHNTNQQDSGYDQNQGMSYSYQSSYGGITMPGGGGDGGGGGGDYTPPTPQEFSVNSSPPKVQPPDIVSPLHFSNNARFWNASTTSMNDVRSSFFPLQMQSPTSTIEDKPKNPTSEMKKSNSKSSSTKRPRNDNPPLPAFKVRKEKMGDRITALQQLVSPFGKTDTASVLSEAIEYIKFLHEQVNVLSTPYMKNGAAIMQQQQISDNALEDTRQDLKSRGLCLVPISSTFPVTHETTVDFWTPSFGGTFR